MNNIVNNIKISKLFNNINAEDINDILKNINYNIRSYKKNQIVAFEGDLCSGVGIIINGCLLVKKILPSGNEVTITHLIQGDIFGEALIFSDKHTFPSTIIATKDSEILFISRESIIDICKINLIFLTNFMKLLSNKLFLLDNKINYLSYKTIREKIANYIYNEYKRQNNLKIILPCTRKEMAEMFGIPRPSLSREMIKMKKEGIINFNKNIVEILNLNKLKSFITL
ncbi:Crp/Fnr family transcriptional regulator [Caloramator sp. CAR-1]|uniref:Crp/Fnr family transcriptional regulator n=1 Tax=Caloramator sp. CAR-1 TaxID=3062777 RepID=UPI0026E35B50|nr:Crp/Fnr family transcriptional regulator [Caloramator sp. CAR-1]MDO6355519.1 Crp/Fnr family transcriptional regulator [Caloramator sp. CAR-1]